MNKDLEALCLDYNHYLGKPLSLPIKKKMCNLCCKELFFHDDFNKSETEQTQSKTNLWRQERPEYARACKEKEMNSIAYAKRCLAAQWKEKNTANVPDELAEIKLLQIQFQRIGRQMSTKTKTKQRGNEDGKGNAQQSFTDW